MIIKDYGYSFDGVPSNIAQLISSVPGRSRVRVDLRETSP